MPPSLFFVFDDEIRSSPLVAAAAVLAATTSGITHSVCPRTFHSKPAVATGVATLDRFRHRKIQLLVDAKATMILSMPARHRAPTHTAMLCTVRKPCDRILSTAEFREEETASVGDRSTDEKLTDPIWLTLPLSLYDTSRKHMATRTDKVKRPVRTEPCGNKTRTSRTAPKVTIQAVQIHSTALRRSMRCKRTSSWIISAVWRCNTTVESWINSKPKPIFHKISYEENLYWF